MGDFRYVLIWRHDDVWAVGPFENAAAASAWGRGYQQLGDDPRWNTIGEGVTRSGLRVVAPDSPAAREGM